MRKLAEALLTSRGVVAFWLLYGLAFVLMLWAVAPGRTLQDALSAELLQGHLSGGYQVRNPPLYEWLLWGVQRVVGPGPLSYLLLRYSLIAAIGILFYVAAQRTMPDRRLAAAFSLSLLLFYWFGWDAHHSVSHTLGLLALTLAFWIVALAYAEQRTVARALVLGVIIGLALMAKWSFALVLLSLGAALAMTASARRLYTDARTLLVLAAATLPVLPFALWLADIHSDLLAERAVPPGQDISAERALAGMLIFATGIPLVFLPWIAFVSFFAWRNPGAPAASQFDAREAIRLALLTAGIGTGLMAAILIGATLSGAVLFGISRFAIHYLYPFCLLAALGIAGLVALRVDAARFAWKLALTALAAACVAFVVKLASFYVLPPRSAATNLLPYAGLAEGLKQQGLGAAQFVTLSPREAGNLTIYLPDARALSLSARIEPPPPDPVGNRPCIVLWGGEYSVPPAPLPPAMPSPAKLLAPLGLREREKDATAIAVDWREPLFGSKRRSVWHILRGADIDLVCRSLGVDGTR